MITRQRLYDLYTIQKKTLREIGQFWLEKNPARLAIG